MTLTKKHIIASGLILALAACSSNWSSPTPTSGGSGGPSGRYPNDNELPKGTQGVKRKVGTPYKVAGKWYHPKEDPYYDEVGYASWYGKDFHGKKTANGEYFNMNALTAAHKTLPLPTFVKVTNLSNGRSIILRVNDRGPFVGTRIIDISRRGAQLLGFQKQGVTRVRVQAVDENGNLPKGAPQPTQTAALGDENHFIQVGSFSSRQNAKKQVQKLKRAGHKARAEQAEASGRILWRVRLGPFIERITAEERLDRVVADGFYEARIFTETVK